MKLKRLAEWIKGKITKYKPGGLQIEPKEETETEAECHNKLHPEKRRKSRTKRDDDRYMNEERW